MRLTFWILFAAALMFAPPAAHAENSALMDQVRIYVPINAISIPCDLEVIDQSANRKMLEAVGSDPDAGNLLRRLHRETQVALRNAGDKTGFCKRFIADHRPYVKARTTQAERLVLAANDRVRNSIARDVCGSGAATTKLSKTDNKASATIRQMLQIEYKVARETNNDLKEVTERFCDAMNNR